MDWRSLAGPGAPATHAWRVVRWQADAPLTPLQREALLEAAPAAFAELGSAAACFPDDATLAVLVRCERFPARPLRDTALWLCAQALADAASVTLEMEGTLAVSDEFAAPQDWRTACHSARELTGWWAEASAMPPAEMHQHRMQLLRLVKRRQYGALGGYVSRALRTAQEPGRCCMAFVPLILEAVWSQRTELHLARLTEGLDLQQLARRPREALAAWLDALARQLRQEPECADTSPMDRVVARIREDCSLPYTQQGLSRSLGVSPSSFCRLFREKTGMHFTTFLTMVRVHRAQELLRTTPDIPLGDLASACGYANRSYFAQVFRRYTGLTPAEYAQRTDDHE